MGDLVERLRDPCGIGAPSDHNTMTEAAGELTRLCVWVDDLQSGMYVNCVYCGHRYGPGETTPVSMADALKAHVEQCSEHPMSKLRAERDEAVASLAVMREALTFHQMWATAEHDGPDYEGMSRDTHPVGERRWRIWWDRQLELCAKANSATTAALATPSPRAQAMLAVVEAARRTVEHGGRLLLAEALRALDSDSPGRGR